MSEKPSYEEMERRIRELEKAESELERVKKALREQEGQEARHRLLVESLPVMICAFLPGGEISFVNKAYCEHFAKRPEELIGSNFLSLIPESEWESVMGNISELTPESPIRSHEHQIISPGGDIRWHRWSNRAIFDTRGNLLHYQSVGEDITEQKRAEEALRRSERKFRSFFDSSEAGVAVVDTRGRFLSINSGACRILGHSQADFSRLTFMDITHPEDVERTLGRFRRCLEDRKPYTVEKRYLTSEKETVWGLTTVTPIFDAHGEFSYAIAHVQDISEQKRTEDALRRSEERFELAMRFANDGLYDWDLKTNGIYFSPVWKSLLGYDEDEIENEFSEWERLTDPEDIKDSWSMLKEVLEGKRERFEKEFRMRHKDGHWVDILSRANAVFDEKGKGVRVLGTHVDITERKRVEREILREKQKAELYLNLASVMFVGLDRDGSVNVTNQKACEILECDEKDILGRNWFDSFIPERMRDDVRAVFAQLIEGRSESAEYHENPVVSKSGREKLIVWHNAFIRDEEGHVVGILGSGEDVTAKRELEAQIRQARKMEYLGNLAGGIAHDFNNILSPIVGMSELLMEELPPGSPEYEKAREILKAGKRGGDLVGQILAFSRKSGHEMLPIRLREALEEPLRLSRRMIPANVEILRETDEHEGLVMADPTQMVQVVLNLVTNACHAMEPSGGSISVRLRESVLGEAEVAGTPLGPGQYAVLSVSDTGKGIEPAMMDKIFDPYFTTKEKGKGTGLGLAVVYGIIEAHGGHIRVSSERGKGTTFHVCLPLTEKSPKTASPEKPGTRKAGNERILLLDDEEVIVRLGKDFLERLGYQVEGYLDSRDAFRAFKANPETFDLVITDMTMPNMTGDRLAKAILSIRPDIPIIICTGFSERITREKAYDMGVRGFLMKPARPSEMADMVRELLDDTKARA